MRQHETLFSPLANDVIKLNLAKARQKDLALTYSEDPELPAYLLGDPTRIQRILLELITNSVNFTHQGSVSLEIQVAKQTQQKVIISMTVKDTGIGIPLDKQNQVFTAFKRLTPAYQGIYPGNGLGLSLVKQLLEEMDGELYFESEPEKGSTFTCLIPLTQPLLPTSTLIRK